MQMPAFTGLNCIYSNFCRNTFSELNAILKGFRLYISNPCGRWGYSLSVLLTLHCWHRRVQVEVWPCKQLRTPPVVEDRSTAKQIVEKKSAKGPLSSLKSQPVEFGQLQSLMSAKG